MGWERWTFPADRAVTHDGCTHYCSDVRPTHAGPRPSKLQHSTVVLSRFFPPYLAFLFTSSALLCVVLEASRPCLEKGRNSTVADGRKCMVMIVWKFSFPLFVFYRYLLLPENSTATISPVKRTHLRAVRSSSFTDRANYRIHLRLCLLCLESSEQVQPACCTSSRW